MFVSILHILTLHMHIFGASQVTQWSGDSGDMGLILGLGRFPEVGNGSPSCLENSIDRGAGWATVHEVTKSWM